MIVLLTNEFPQHAGGIATYCYELAKSMSKRDCSVTVVAAQKHPDDTAFDRAQTFSIHRVPEDKIAVLRQWKRYWAVYRCIRKTDPTLLWASDWRTGITLLPLSLQFGIPYVVSAYGTEVLMATESRYRRHLALEVFKRSRLVLSISNYTRQLLIELGVPEDKIKVTLLGVNPDEFQPDRLGVARVLESHNLKDQKVILTLARLTARKGQDVIIRAMPEILSACPNAVYLIGGRGEDEGRLRDLVSELSLESHVIFAGYVNDADKAAYYKACDVFAMISRQDGRYVEGFGLTLLEAAACCRPAVAGRHGGVPEIVSHGVTGLLVDPISVQDVASAIIRLLNDEMTASQMGRAAHLQVRQSFNWDKTAEQTIAEMARVLRQ